MKGDTNDTQYIYAQHNSKKNVTLIIKILGTTEAYVTLKIDILGTTTTYATLSMKTVGTTIKNTTQHNDNNSSIMLNVVYAEHNIFSYTEVLRLKSVNFRKHQ
jgi:hypothetical protein